MRFACPWPWKLSNSRLAQGGAVFGGGKGGSGGTTYQTQTTTIPPEVRARYDAVNARAEQVAQTPFQPYTGQFVAPLTGTQQAGINQIAQAGQAYQPYQQAATSALTGAAETALPYYGAAGQALQSGAQAALPFYGQAAQGIQQAQMAGQPYQQMATAAGLAGTQAVNAQPLQIGQYMDPYIQSVVAPTMQGLYQQQQQQQSQLMGEQAMRGAFGGDRGSIAAANLARQQALAAQQAQAGLLSGAYGQGLQAAQQQQGVNLGAQQANRAALAGFAPQALAIGQQGYQQGMGAAQAQQALGQGLFGMGQGMAQGQLGIGQGLLGYGQGVAGSLAGLGQQGAQTGLATGQALLGAGTLEQQTQQQLNSALYNQYLQQQGYPFQVAQFLANIALGTGPLYGSTQTGVTGQPTPFFSDERVKEDIREIGRTHDGQKIIKFRYKGEPEGTSHIGLSAQDVEKHHPEAVSETPEGIKAVDYDAATKHAERAYGGLVPMSSEGGAVHPSMAGLGFAAGGVPVPGANPTTEDMKRGLAPRMMFAAGGTPGVDPTSQQILDTLNPMSKTLPHGSFGSLPGKGGAWSPKLAVQSPGLKPPSLPALPAQGKTGLGQAMDAVNSAAGVYGTGEKLVEGGQKAYDWLKKQASNQQIPGASPDGATTKPGAITRSELPAPAESASAPAQSNGLGAAAPTQQTADATGLAPAVEQTPTMLADATEPMTDMGADAMSMFAARGGRIHRAGGGGMPTDLPYSNAEGEYVPEKLTESEPTPKLDEPKMQMHPQGGGQQKDKTASTALGLAGLGASFIPGVGPFLGAGLKAASMFAARGGAMDYADVVERGESGGRNVRNPLSGAGGHFQFMPATWASARRALPHLPADVMDATAAQQREAMDWLTSQNRRALSSSLGRDPSDAELRYAHYFGPSGAAALMRLDPSTRFADLPQDFWRRLGERFDNRTLLAQNPNLRDETVGGLLGKYRGEFGAPSPMTRKGLAPAETPRGGLAPMTVVEDMPEVDTAEFRSLDLPKTFATGGVAGRHGYQTAGAVTPDGTLEPDVQAALTAELEGRTTPAQPAGMPATTGVAPPRAARPATPPSVVRVDERTRDDRDLAGYNPPGLALPPKVPGVADDRDLFNRMGDWYERNQNWLLPLVSGIGKTLSSPSPYLGVAIGQGLAEAAPTALAANFKQQGLDINMMDRLSKQINVLAAEAASRGGPGMSPELDKAQQAAMARYYKLSGVNYTPTSLDPRMVQERLARSPFKGVVFTDNPDLLANAANTPGLSSEQRMAYLEASEKAMQRIRDKGFARGENDQIVQFPNYQEAERNAVFYSTATRTAAATQGELSVPQSAAAINALNAQIEGARNDVSAALRDFGVGSPQAEAARRRFEELNRQKAALGTGRAFGGRTGYATDGAVDDVEESPVQLAQAYPKGPSLPPMPAPPTIPRTAPSIAPPSDGTTITITPRPQGGAGTQAPDAPPSAPPGFAPKTIEDYHKLITEYGSSAQPADLAEWQAQRARLMQQALEKKQVVDPSTGKVSAVPSATAAERDVKFGEQNTQFLSSVPSTLNALETENAQNQQIAKLMQIFETGAWADPKADIIARLRSITGNEFPSTATANPAAREVMLKIMQDRMSRNLSMAGGNKLNAQIEGLQQSQPEPTKQPEANRKVAAWMTAVTNWQRKYVEDYAREAHDNPMLNPDTFVENWLRDNRLEKYYNEAYRTTAVRGDLPIDDPNKLVVGRHYVAEKNQLGLPNGNDFGVWEYRGRAQSGPNKGQLGWKRVQ